MSSYLRDAATTRRTPQSEAIPSSAQVPNSAGGFAWEIDDLTRLRRFLILGSAGGSYYAAERELTRENVDAVLRALDDHGVAAVEVIVDVSQRGLAPKNDEALYALAVAAAHRTDEVRAAALRSLSLVARTATHLFMFMTFVDGFRGRGRGLLRAVARWYEEKTPDDLAYQMIKYRERGDWTHLRAIRASHPRATTPSHAALYTWESWRRSEPETRARHPYDEDALPGIVRSFLIAQRSSSARDTAALLRDGCWLPREALLTEHLNDVDVWRALLPRMPMTALVRNLATMTRNGVLKPFAPEVVAVRGMITNGERLRKARVHPFSLLLAGVTYAAGRSMRGDGTWDPIPQVVDAVDEAFYAAFETVEPTGMRMLVALDVSGSMGSLIGGTFLTARAGAAAMAMATVRSEPNYFVVGFTGGDLGGGAWAAPGRGGPFAIPAHMPYGIAPLPFVTPRARLDELVARTTGLPFGPTDCSLPMLYAIERELSVDCFVVYTDSETWFGEIHPAQALREYRRRSGIAARLIVVAMVPNRFSIADPNDAGMLDVVGFDASAPALISAFAAGGI